MELKKRLPDYSTIIGEDAEIEGDIRFCGGIHIDGKVIGDVSGISDDGCALTLSQSGVIEGDLEVAHVVLDGTVIGDVRASHRAELAPGARVEGDVYYDALEMAEGAKVNGKLLHVDQLQSPRLALPGAEIQQTRGAVDDENGNIAKTPIGGEIETDKLTPGGEGNT
jgi:cytoskeletal protein CcmA (bactofilin family)